VSEVLGRRAVIAAEAFVGGEVGIKEHLGGRTAGCRDLCPGWRRHADQTAELEQTLEGTILTMAIIIIITTTIGGKEQALS
jgi:hypothetical protein